MHIITKMIIRTNTIPIIIIFFKLFLIKYDTKSENKKRELKEKAIQKLNSKCLCGSGKKYKNCCLKKNN